MQQDPTSRGRVGGGGGSPALLILLPAPALSGTGHRERQDRQRLSCLAAASDADFALCIEPDLRKPTDNPATSMHHGSHPALPFLPIFSIFPSLIWVTTASGTCTTVTAPGLVWGLVLFYFIFFKPHLK